VRVVANRLGGMKICRSGLSSSLPLVVSSEGTCPGRGFGGLPVYRYRTHEPPRPVGRRTCDRAQPGPGSARPEGPGRLIGIYGRLDAQVGPAPGRHRRRRDRRGRAAACRGSRRTGVPSPARSRPRLSLQWPWGRRDRLAGRSPSLRCAVFAPRIPGGGWWWPRPGPARSFAPRIRPRRSAAPLPPRIRPHPSAASRRPRIRSHPSAAPRVPDPSGAPGRPLSCSTSCALKTCC
jgi:hypothetical protein